ncbi:MAG TPA: class I SAM-dependent methyltransferase, partial [Nevskiaceae bacterium]|nr:class I SAM-dependent methyltransferase [Nevskiaceae bacterium]
MEQDQDKFDRVMSRDGFSPDWPAQSPRAREGLLLRLFLRMLARLRIGTLDVRLPSGELRSFRGSERQELHGVLQIRDERLMWQVLRNGEVGFGEAYVDGLWDSPDLTRLLMLLYLNEPYLLGALQNNALSRLAGWVTHRLRANSRRQARRNIEYHYDLGNEFYKLWLDETMTYSSALFEGPSQTLLDAQLNKFASMLRRLDLKPEHRLLEIGSGWGGFAIYAAQNSGCRVHSITLSTEQLVEARRRAEAAGVADRVTFELRDYRDIEGQYDRV